MRYRNTTAPLADADVLAARRALLQAPGMAPLRAFVAGLRASHGPVPDFDPLDGGVGARILLLLETPGPAIWRTGFVSVDNASGTSANLSRFMAEAMLDRRRLAIWNAVPWVIHTGGPNRAPKAAEIRSGLAMLPPLLRLLPNLCCVVLAGRVAGLAEPVLREAAPGMASIRVPHPSPVYVCTDPDIPRRIVAGFQLAVAQSASPSLAG